MEQMFDVGETFGIAMDGTFPIEGLDSPTEYTPSSDPDYVFRLDYIRLMLGFWLSGEIFLALVGHRGCGKTSFIMQWHARLNLPLLTVVAHQRMEIDDLIGRYLPNEDGSLSWRDGPVLTAAKLGMSVLLDEYYVLDPGVTTGLNGLLQGDMIVIPETGEVVRVAPGFRVFAATNPADPSAGYFGRNQQDAANIDRGWLLQMDYPTPDEELPLVMKELVDGGLPDKEIAKSVAQQMVDVANDIRGQFCGVSDQRSALPITMSTRSLRRWAKVFCIFSRQKNPAQFAMNIALTGRTDAQSARAIMNIVDVKFGVA